jgi:uncharacterized protein (DUF2126 family)/transglutaminase-like putative cysteine protease
MSVKVSLNHQLKYSFSHPVILGPHVLGLRPSPHCQTPIQSYALKIYPQEHYLTWRQDIYGNFFAKVNFPQLTAELRIEVDLIAQLQTINPFNFLLEDYAVTYPFSYTPQEKKELAAFLEVSEAQPLLRHWVENHRQENVYTVNFLSHLNGQLAGDIGHIIRLEEGIHSCEETLSTKQGSCRDTAWLLVQILRHYGLAARFVSGYLIQLKPDIAPLDGPMGSEVDNGELHAWTEVYLPGAGWIGLDPTSGMLTAEGHLPLVCTPEPAAASAVRGSSELCESQLDFSIVVSRHQEKPRATKPFTEGQWERINLLGARVEQQLQDLGVGLRMGGEPTFVSIDDFSSAQWRVEALGEEKKAIAFSLWQGLAHKFAGDGGLLLRGIGKKYAGENLPRWSLECYWRRDGMPIWGDGKLIAQENIEYSYNLESAESFIKALAGILGIGEDRIIPAYEAQGDSLAGYILPLLPLLREEKLCWGSCRWELPQDKLYLLEGEGAIGLRLPLDSIAWAEDLVEEYIYSPQRHKGHKGEGVSWVPNSIRIALAVEIDRGRVKVFIPPFAGSGGYLDLVDAIENTASGLKVPVLLEGYAPGKNQGIEGFQITPDPGVIEVNIHPAATWQELVEITSTLYEEARLCRLGTEKYLLDGRTISTGGGSHITLGGESTEESPLLRRPDLLRSLISYWINHPSLSYLFSGLFVGPSSQAPRVDEGRYESLYELEIAFRELQPGKNVPPWLLDRLLRHLLTDVTGNTHRSGFCIDKLFPVENPPNQLGLLEMRFFSMAPHPRMSLLQMLLVRALVAWFWQQPYTKNLIRWGTTLHDRFMLPHYLREDLQQVIEDLGSAGYPLELDWFEAFFNFRFPIYGEVAKEGIELEIRAAIEPWPVLGEEVTSGGTARYVDDSMERIQVTLRNALAHSPHQDNFSSRYAVHCQGKPLPLKSTGVLGEYVGGVRFRARNRQSQLHPAINPHNPLLFEVIDTWTRRAIFGCTYYVDSPSGQEYQDFPINEREAQCRMNERFIPLGHSSGMVKVRSSFLSPEYPLTLDLRN